MANWNFFLFLLFFFFLPREDIQSQLHYEKIIIFYLFQFSNFSLPYYLRYSSPSFIIIIIISYEDERESKSSSSNSKDILIKVNASVPNASFRFRSLK